MSEWDTEWDTELEESLPSQANLRASMETYNISPCTAKPRQMHDTGGVS